MVLHPKHQKKVLECYPDASFAGNQQAMSMPISAKLSALTYYINAKPQKLNKVMPFLEKKVKKDLIKESTAYNMVTIGILNGIIRECSEYFDGFATNYLNIMIIFSEKKMEINDEFFQKLIESWEYFCVLLKSKLPIIRNDTFFNLFTQLLSQLSQIKDEIWKLRSISAVTKIDDFKTFKGEDRMKLIVDSLLSISQDYWEESLKIISIISQNCNTVSLSYFLDSCFKYWNSLNWDLQGHIRALLNVIIENLPSQYLYHYINSAWQQAMNGPGETSLVPLIDSIAQLLISNRGPLGYSALQIASNLMKLMRKEKPVMSMSFMPTTPEGLDIGDEGGIIPSAPTTINNKRERDQQQHQIKQPTSSVFSICNALISILRNTTFAPQKHEIICHLINRVFFPEEYKKRPTSVNVKTAITGSDSILQAVENKSLMTVSLNSTEESQYKNVMWSVLFSMAEESLNQSTFAFLAYSDIPERLLEFIYRMIQCPDAETRLNSLILFHILLSNGLCLSGRQPISSSIVHSRPISTSLILQQQQQQQQQNSSSTNGTGGISSNTGTGANNAAMATTATTTKATTLGATNRGGSGGLPTIMTRNITRSATLNRVSLSYFAGARASLYISMIYNDNILEHYAAIYNCMIDILDDGDEINALILVQLALQVYQHLKRRKSIDQVTFFYLLIIQFMDSFSTSLNCTIEINPILENFREKLKMANFYSVKLCNVLERTEPIPVRLASDQVELVDFDNECAQPIKQALKSKFEFAKNLFQDESHYVPEDELDKMSNIATPDVKKFIPSHLLQVPPSTDKTILHRHSLISLNSETIQSSTIGAYNASITGMSLPTPGYQSSSIVNRKMGASNESLSLNGEKSSSQSDYYGDSNLLEGKFEQLTMKSKESRSKKEDLKKRLFQSDKSKK